MSQRLLVGMVVLALVTGGTVAGTTELGGSSDRPTATAPPADAPTVVSTDAVVTGAQAQADARGALGRSERRQGRCSYRRLYENATESVVAVTVSNESGPVAGGSGWVYRRNGSTAYVVTNWHVIFNGTEFDVQFADGGWRTAELVGADVLTDLAVLRVENAPASATALELARNRADQGQQVAALGSPFGLEESLSTGVVSGVERAVTVEYRNNVTSTIPDTIQLDAAVNPGNSGGPLVNCRGRVLGVNYAGSGPFDAGVNFAISTTVVGEVVPALVENGSYTHSFLGVRAVDVDPTVAEANRLNLTRGVMVAGVVPESPADGPLRGAPAVHRETGVPYDGDVVLAMNETRIEDREDLLTYLLFETAPGDTVDVTVLRDGANRTVEVTLGRHPLSVAAAQRTTTPPPTTPTTTTTETPPTTTPTTTTTTETVQPAIHENRTRRATRSA